MSLVRSIRWRVLSKPLWVNAADEYPLGERNAHQGADLLAPPLIIIVPWCYVGGKIEGRACLMNKLRFSSPFSGSEALVWPIGKTCKLLEALGIGFA